MNEEELNLRFARLGTWTKTELIQEINRLDAKYNVVRYPRPLWLFKRHDLVSMLMEIYTKYE